MGAGDNKKSLLRSSTNPQDFYEPSIAFGLTPLGLGWMGAGDNKKSLLRIMVIQPKLKALFVSNAMASKSPLVHYHAKMHHEVLPAQSS